MKISHMVKFQLNEQYEMYQVTFEMDTSELTKEQQSLSLPHQCLLVQKELVKQGCMFQVAKGYRTMDLAKKELERWSALVPKS